MYQEIDPNLIYLEYCRKSSEDKNRQVLSINDQKRELRELAEKLNLKVKDILDDERSAHSPGRKGFNEMIRRIEDDEANAILVWMSSRLSRNPIDSGQIIYLMDTGKLKEVRTPYRVYRNTPDDKFMLALDMGGDKKDSDIKSVSVKRALKTKLEMGCRPGPAPPGYLNDQTKPHGLRDIKIDKKRFPLIRKAWDLLLTEDYVVSKILDILNNKWGFRTRKTRKQGGKPLSIGHLYKIFSEPFYYGEYWWKNPDTGERELRVGKHRPMITKGEFERAQMLLGRKGKPQPKTREFSFTGMIHCGKCGSSVTAEEKNQLICTNCKEKFAYENKFECPKCGMEIAKMKKPTMLHHTYYHCTKSKDPHCDQKSLRLDRMEKQINEGINALEIDEEYLKLALDYLNEKREPEMESIAASQKSLQEALNDARGRLKRLNKEYTSSQNLDYSIYTPDEFKKYKAEIKGEIKGLEEELKGTKDKADDWLEASERTFNFCRYANYHFNHGTLQTKKEILSGMGSNLILKDQKLIIQEKVPFLKIKDSLTEVRALKERLEPAILGKNEAELSLYPALIQCWLRG